MDIRTDKLDTFWCIWDGQELAGFGAPNHLTESHAEVKSMRTAASHLRRGAGSMLLQHLIQEAISRGYSRLSAKAGHFRQIHCTDLSAMRENRRITHAALERHDADWR